jgi:hypothetical protein
VSIDPNGINAEFKQRHHYFILFIGASSSSLLPMASFFKRKNSKPSQPPSPKDVVFPPIAGSPNHPQPPPADKCAIALPMKFDDFAMLITVGTSIIPIYGY